MVKVLVQVAPGNIEWREVDVEWFTAIETPEPLQFGDFVRVNDQADISAQSPQPGMVGKVVGISPTCYAVELPEFKGGHNCALKCAQGHGWYFRREELDLI